MKPRAWLILAGLAAALTLAAPAPAQDKPADQTPAPAAETVEVLTLEQALAIALAQNKDIQKAKEYRNLVQGRYVEERAAAFPSLTVQSGFYRTRDESQRALMPGIPVQNEYRDGKMVLRQALFTWGQVSAAIRGAEVGLLTADDQLRLHRQAALRDVSAAFHDVLLAKELAAIARQNLEQKERHLDQAQRRFTVGLATDYDVLAAGVAVQNARPDVIRTANMILTARERLGFLLGRDGRRLDASGSLGADPLPPPPYDQTLGLALERRPELMDLRHRREIAKELVTVYSAGDKPRLDLQAEYGWRELKNGNNEYDGMTGMAGVFLTFPLFDGLRANGKVAQARSDEASLRIEEAKLKDSVALQVSTAINDIEENREILVGLKGAETQAERLLFMAEKGFEYGVKTKLEVDDAQVNLMQARGNLAKARRDYLVARVNLKWVSGVLGEELPAAGAAQSF